MARGGSSKYGIGPHRSHDSPHPSSGDDELYPKTEGLEYVKVNGGEDQLQRETCESCCYWVESLCNRYPQSVKKDSKDWCGEHTTRHGAYVI